ncbi:hypothetical protein C0J52_25173 [Blattella germanica]|nr:hypothetical protein C0J52_25173 [Blattella germanica]
MKIKFYVQVCVLVQILGSFKIYTEYILWPHHEKSRGLDARGKRGFSLLSHTHYSKNINSLTY